MRVFILLHLEGLISGVDVEGEGGHHADLVVENRLTTLDVPIGSHVVDGVDAFAEVRLVKENLVQVDDEKD